MEDIQFRDGKGQTIQEATKDIVYPPFINLTTAERDWWADVAHRLNRRVGICEGNIEELKEVIEELKKQRAFFQSQIPDKKGKKLSQRDKASLRRVRNILGSFSDDDKASDDPIDDDWYDDETLKLLDRLLK